MNLAESLKHVLKSQTGNLFTAFWKNDVKIILSDVKNDFRLFKKSSLIKINQMRKRSAIETLSEMKDSALDTILVVKVVPLRIKDGFSFFADDFLEELDKLPDQKQKTLFGLKVLGALSTTMVSAFYGMRKAQDTSPFIGLRLRSAFAHYLVTEMVFKISQVFILRFISEVEKELTQEQDKEHLRYFKQLISDKKKLENPEIPAEVRSEEGDKALELVERLRQYIMTGKKA